MTDYNTSLDQIATLVNQFRTNLAAYHAPGYKEAHARQDLIDPLFIALDWDVHNTRHIAPQYREVIPEDSLDVEGQRKAPDYAFRVGKPIFYAEAKKPGVALKTAAGPAYQLRRYAWSAKLPLSILTDFEEFAVYDCRARPSDKDKASAGRINYVTFEEYPDRWREIWDVFSRDAVLGGSFDQFVQASKGRGTSEVDAEFLREIEGWRDVLAHNMALRNPGLGIDDLNDAVQRTIDRLLFLRMAEDRGIEPYEQLRHLADKEGVYSELIDLCGKADARYNAGLFNLSPTGDRITPALTVDDKALKPIVTSLYFPQSPYEFSVLPVRVLGNIYEQFLGKVIRLTAAHQAKVEAKPEVRKAGGVFYTPEYIVDYIVKNTVGKLVEGKDPKQLAGDPKGSPFRVLDMACGSGSFLLGAYQFLLDYYLRWYTEHKPEKHAHAVQKHSDGWRLTLAEKKRILTTHIFGVDIDRQAVEVTKLSLLLKVTETLQMAFEFAQERVLPNLDNNIKCGNSLIGPDYLTGQLMPEADELRRVNPVDWEHEFPDAMKAGGFDCVIGNPPYIRMESFKELKNYLKANYASHDERSDLYVYFTERAHKLLKRHGRFGMIVSNKFLRANYGRPLREFLRQNATIERIVDFAGLPVFPGATVRTIILLTSRGSESESSILYTPPPIAKFQAVTGGSLSVEQAITDFTYPVAADTLAQSVWSFAPHGASTLLSRLQSTCIPLANYCDGQIGYGIKSGLEEAFVIDSETRKRIISRNKRAVEIIKPYINGRDVRRYLIDFKDIYLIYTYHGVDIAKYTAIIDYLNPYKDRLRRRATKQEWFELQQPQLNYSPHFDASKIVFPDIALAPRFALDETGYYGSTTIFFIARRDLYLLGLLNSRLSQFYFVKTCAALEGKAESYLRFKRQYVEGFPVHSINFSDPADVARHDRMVTLVEQMLQLYKQQAAASERDRELHQRQIEATDREIDRLVYELYGLNEEEIAVVEGNR